MKKLIYLITIFMFVSCTKDRNYPSNVVSISSSSVLIYYWNFNATSGTLSFINPDYSLFVSNAKITYPGTGAGYMDSFSPAYNNNLRNNDLGGAGLKVRNPSYSRALIMAMPTNNFKNIVIQFDTAKSGNSGATTQNYSYTVDGTNYIITDLIVNTFNPLDDPNVNATGTLSPVEVSKVALDFRNIAGANNNPNFKLKISFAGATVATTSGNNRFDNITLEAEPN
ncbi:MAG: hypothetical protein H7174_06740 [Flavobacterium sp.]|nr:hypothetical protein [Flavobacterium sp.]